MCGPPWPGCWLRAGATGELLALAEATGTPVYTLPELETAVRTRTLVVSLVFNNQMYGTIRMHQERRFPGRQVATGLGEVNFTEIARAFGCHAERIERTADVAGALERALRSGRPASGQWSGSGRVVVS